MEKIRSKALTGVYWSSIERFGTQGIQFIISIILARLLEPGEFGIIGMIIIFMAIGQVFVNSGFGSALIQQQETSIEEESSVFWFNLIVGILFSVILWFVAPLIARFYATPVLTGITRAMTLTIVVSSVSIVQINLLSKALRFKEQAIAALFATLGSGIAGIWLAFKGFGVWSLVWQSVTATVITTVIIWYLSDWRPKLFFRISRLSNLYSYGSKLLLSGLLESVFSNLYYVVIGKFYSAQLLGFYTRAKNTQNIPVSNITLIASKVTFPVFSSLSREPEKMSKGFEKALTSMAFVLFPILVGIIIVAKPLTIVLFGENWLPSVPLLQLLCLAGFFYPLHVLNLNVLLALGRSDLYFKLELIKKILLILAIAATVKFGLISLILGEFVFSGLALVVNSYYTKQFINYGFYRQMRNLAPYFIAALLMGLCTYPIKYLFVGNLNLALLCTQVFTGICSYACFSFFLKFEIIYEICGKFSSFIFRGPTKDH